MFGCNFTIKEHKRECLSMENWMKLGGSMKMGARTMVIDLNQKGLLSIISIS